MSWNDNTPEELAIAGAVAGGLFLLLWAIKALCSRRFRNAAETSSPVDDFVLLLAQKTKLYLILIPCITIGMRSLELPRALREPLATAMLIACIAQCTLWITAIVDLWLRRYRRTRLESDPASVMTINVFRIAALAALWLFAGVLAIHNLGFNVTALITGLGIGGVAVALATQNILADLFASLSIVLDKPFILGDGITVDRQSGSVEHIGLKTTRLRAPTGEQVIFSNADLLKSRIHNFARVKERRSQSRIAVAYGTPAERLATIPALLRSVVEAHPGARFDRAHLVTLGEEAYEFELSFLTPASHAEFLDVQQAVLLDVVRAFETAGLSLAERHRKP